jgi:isoleucyl-tRNA synthetase
MSSSSTTDATNSSNSSSNSNGSNKFTPSPEVAAASTNVMDIWVQASLQGLIQFVHEEMAAYRLYTVVPKLVDFIQDLTNWYVCMCAKLCDPFDIVTAACMIAFLMHTAFVQ